MHDRIRYCTPRSKIVHYTWSLIKYAFPVRISDDYSYQSGLNIVSLCELINVKALVLILIVA